MPVMSESAYPPGLADSDATPVCELWTFRGPCQPQYGPWVDIARLYAALWSRPERSRCVFSQGKAVDVLALGQKDWTDSYYSGTHHPGTARTFAPEWFSLSSTLKRQYLPRLLVRPEYRELIADIDKRRAIFDSALVLGWSGIGISMFMRIYLAELLMRGERVLWFNPGAPASFFAFDGDESGGRVRMLTADALESFLYFNPRFHGCFALFDSTSANPEPPARLAGCEDVWFVHTTCENNHAWPWRRRCMKWWMQPCTWPEIYVLARRDPLASETGVRDAYLACGPCIYLVNNRQLPILRDQVRAQTKRRCANLAHFDITYYRARGLLSDGTPAYIGPPELFIPVPPCTGPDPRRAVDFYPASEQAMRQLQRSVWRMPPEERAPFLESVRRTPRARPVYARLFERGAVQWLYDCRARTDIPTTGLGLGARAGGTALIPWPADMRVVLCDALAAVREEWARAGDVLLVPFPHTRTAFTAVARIGAQVYLFVMTVRTAHDVPVEGLQEVAETLGGALPYRLVFVLPADDSGAAMTTRQRVVQGSCPSAPRTEDSTVGRSTASGPTDISGACSSSESDLDDLDVPLQKRQRTVPADDLCEDDVPETVAYWRSEAWLEQYVWRLDIHGP